MGRRRSRAGTVTINQTVPPAGDEQTGAQKQVVVQGNKSTKEALHELIDMVIVPALVARWVAENTAEEDTNVAA